MLNVLFLNEIESAWGAKDDSPSHTMSEVFNNKPLELSQYPT